MQAALDPEKVREQLHAALRPLGSVYPDAPTCQSDL